MQKIDVEKFENHYNIWVPIVATYSNPNFIVIFEFSMSMFGIFQNKSISNNFPKKYVHPLASK